MIDHTTRKPSRQTYRDGCRCAECAPFREAFLAHKRERDAERRARARQAREDGTLVVDSHGIGGYQRGCRCDECRAASRERTRVNRAVDVPPPDWSEVAHLMVGANVRRRGDRGHLHP